MDFLPNICSLLNKGIRLGRELERRVAAGEAFSPFAENLINQGETGISNILAMLLSPSRKHGQGALFLDGFLGLPPDCPIIAPVARQGIIVSTERLTWEDDSKRRVDIMLEAPDFVLAIENKIWAQDQSRQLADYLRWLQHIADGRSFFLVYLTPYGHRPAAHSLPEADAAAFAGHYAELSWLDVLAMLEKSAENVPIKIKIFVQDFCAAFRAELGTPNELETNMDNAIANFIARESSDDELIATGEIHSNYMKAASTIISDWSLRIEEELVRRGVDQARRCIAPNLDQGVMYFITIPFPELEVEIDVYAEKDYGWAFTWSIIAQTWNFKDATGSVDYQTCLSFPPIKALLKRFDHDQFPAVNCICRNTSEDLPYDNPLLLNRLRQPGIPWLGDELYNLCLAVEKTRS